ncbi:alpha/beta fold hydrolase [Mesorhizobium sp. LjNodule214]|uniref:alpha/beta fold hydrolase n=1 Tax=Mesorhizobium sp. LjNodule214 TaxID=3342252 RepID=UPI003F4FE494
MPHTSNQSPHSRVSFQDAPTRSVDVGGTAFVYRELGPRTGVPVILLNHLAAQLDNFDPRIVDGLAATRRVIAFDNRGIGASGGKTPSNISAMARDAVAFIRALGFEEVDLFGFSLGGFVAQEIVLTEPTLVRKLILAGTGPAGGEGIDKVTPLTIVDMIKGALTFRDAKYYLFFTTTPNGRRAANAFLDRLKERNNNRDKAISLSAFGAQLKAIKAYGLQARQDLSTIRIPTLVVIGEGRSPAIEKQRDKRRLKEATSFGEFGQKWLTTAPMADSTRAMRRSIFERELLPVWRNRLSDGNHAG